MSEPPSSSGLGHRPFTAAARVRIPLGVPLCKLRPVRLTGLNTFREILEKEEKRVLSQRHLLGAQQLELNRQNSLRYDEQSKDPTQSLLLKARKPNG